MLRQWLAALFGTFFGFAVLYHFAPAVVADYLDSNTVQTVDAYAVEKADCKLYLHVVTHCAIVLRERHNPKTEAVSLSHVYFGKVGDAQIVPVAIGAGSLRLSVSSGIENLRGRMTAMFLVAVMAFTSLMGCAHMADMKS
jgi:hypothetical protein